MYDVIHVVVCCCSMWFGEWQLTTDNWQSTTSVTMVLTIWVYVGHQLSSQRVVQWVFWLQTRPKSRAPFVTSSSISPSMWWRSTPTPSPSKSTGFKQTTLTTTTTQTILTTLRTNEYVISDWSADVPFLLIDHFCSFIVILSFAFFSSPTRTDRKTLRFLLITTRPTWRSRSSTGRTIHPTPTWDCGKRCCYLSLDLCHSTTPWLPLNWVRH